MTVNFTKEALDATKDALMFMLVENGKGNLNLDAETHFRMCQALGSLREAKD